MNKPVLKILKLHKYWLLAGIFLVLLGFAFLSFAGNMNQKSNDFYRLTIAPVCIVAGYTALVFSILFSSKK